jgi:hypothetical protein
MMKTTHIVFVLFLVLSASILQFCKDNPTSVPSERVYGTSTISNEDLSQPSDMHGTRVVIEGESLETLTDSAGKWTIWNPPHRPFTIVVSRSGYGENKFDVSEFNGGEVSNVWLPLYHEPSYTVASVEVSIAGDTITISGNPSAEPTYRHWYFLYWGRVPPVSNDPSTWIGVGGAIRVLEGETGFRAWSTRSYLLGQGLKSGDTVHVAVYPGSSTFQNYWNTSMGCGIVGTGIGQIPKRTSFVLP